MCLQVGRRWLAVTGAWEKGGRFVVLSSPSRSRRFTALIHQVKVMIYEVSGVTSRVSMEMDEILNPLIPANSLFKVVYK